MEYQTLITTETNNLSESEKDFLFTHSQIMRCGQTAAANLVEMSAKLKEMRDKKLYKAANFDTFDEYVEGATPFKKRQAYNYIEVYEKLPKDWLQSNATLGVTKLSLLVGLSAAQREEIEGSGVLEDGSVADLKKKIKELEERTKQLGMFEERASELEGELEDVRKESDKAMRSAAERERKLKEERDKINLELSELSMQLSEEKKKPEKIVYQPDVKQLEEIEKLKKEVEKAKNAEEKAKKDLEEIKKKPQEVVGGKAEERIKAAEEKAMAAETEAEKLKKKLAIANDETMLKFKIAFENFQTVGAEMMTLLAVMDNEKAEKCKKALSAVLGGWNL